MARGSEAKDIVTKKIEEFFGANYINTIDKKIYIKERENDEDIVIAISLTCPKKTIEEIAPSNMNFSSGEKEENSKPNVELTTDEKELIENIMNKLDL